MTLQEEEEEQEEEVEEEEDDGDEDIEMTRRRGLPISLPKDELDGRDHLRVIPICICGCTKRARSMPIKPL
ncbi:hypothetical protein M0804_010752 [Polistes exclamans]|nr:hypothetical protein M0804_010752 [Polistes exclamans]